MPQQLSVADQYRLRAAETRALGKLRHRECQMILKLRAMLEETRSARTTMTADRPTP